MDHFLAVHYDLRATAMLPKRDKKATSKGGLAGALLNADDEDEEPVGLTLDAVIERVKASALSVKGSRITWQVLLRKLSKLHRLGIFDKGDDLGDYSELLKPKHVSVFDVSNSFNVWMNNIVISDILKGIFRAKRQDRDNRLPPVMVVIEEAHSFVSRENADRMRETLDTLRDISRRGRKRWISLCFISQQPAHLPPEIYELCNTKIVHQTTGGKNLDALKNSAGGVNSSIWSEVPVLGQGRALILSPQYRHPILCEVRPCSSNRRMTE
jgi:DNA helicase HerA-like ATPase